MVAEKRKSVFDLNKDHSIFNQSDTKILEILFDLLSRVVDVLFLGLRLLRNHENDVVVLEREDVVVVLDERVVHAWGGTSFPRPG